EAGDVLPSVPVPGRVWGPIEPAADLLLAVEAGPHRRRIRPDPAAERQSLPDEHRFRPLPGHGATETALTAYGVRGRLNRSIHGIAATGSVISNPSTPLLYEHAIARGEARLGEGGPLVVDTGVHTGRSPKDKFVVREPGSESRIWWDGNKELSEDAF